MLKRVLLSIGSIFVFLLGCYAYGMILNLRTDTLSERMAELHLKSINNPSIVIDKKHYTLTLYSDSIEVKEYRAVFGKGNQDKQAADELSTPVGEYEICQIDTAHIYHKFFRLNYPNISDLRGALRAGLITKQDFENMSLQSYYSDSISQSSFKWRKIGLHGIGQLNFLFKNLPFVFNWTDGSIAISNEEIDELYGVIQKGTKVTIF
jgi:hypothetical protein